MRTTQTISTKNLTSSRESPMRLGLSNLQVRSKSWLILGIAMLGMVVVAAVATSGLKTIMLEDRKTKTRHLVEVAYSLLERYGDQVRSGALTREEAQREAIAAIKRLRYDEDDYFWINDMHSRMVMHPYKPELEGQDLSRFEDPSGKRLIVAFVETVRERGEGFVDYLWPKPGMERPVPKISFVKGYQPWGWIVGSGIYLDDVETTFWHTLFKLGFFSGLVLLGGTFLVIYLVGTITAPLKNLTEAAHRITRGELNVELDTDRSDEIGILAQAFDSMVKRLTEQIETLEDRISERTAELSRANAELVASNERLRELDELKSSFLSSVSHELRTPLTSIRGFAHLIARDFDRSFLPLSESDTKLEKRARRLRENVSVIEAEAERLTRLINDVLDLSKIESGRVEWQDAPVSMDDLFQRAVSAVRGQFELRPQVRLDVECPANLPNIIADRDRLIQVLVNLLNNAAKFTEQGQVRLSASWEPNRDNRQWIHIKVHDTGCGFPPDQAEAIFDKFHQVNHGDTLVDKPTGTGLGLPICREIVERHGGKVFAESEPGRGSTFHVLLPVEGAAAEAPARLPEPLLFEEGEGEGEETRPVGEGHSLLVVEDDAAVRAYLSQLLVEHGYRVDTAPDGREGVEKALAQHPDAVIMDLDLPRLAGRDAIRILYREMPDIPVIVVSGMPDLEQVGADAAIEKPVDEERLLHTLRLLIGGSRREKVRVCMVLGEGESPPPIANMVLSQPDDVEIWSIEEFRRHKDNFSSGMLVLSASVLDGIDLDEALHRAERVLIITASATADGEKKKTAARR